VQEYSQEDQKTSAAQHSIGFNDVVMLSLLFLELFDIENLPLLNSVPTGNFQHLTKCAGEGRPWTTASNNLHDSTQPKNGKGEGHGS